MIEEHLVHQLAAFELALDELLVCVRKRQKMLAPESVGQRRQLVFADDTGHERLELARLELVERLDAKAAAEDVIPRLVRLIGDDNAHRIAFAACHGPDIFARLAVIGGQ